MRGLGVIGDMPSREYLLASLQSGRGFVQVTAARVLANIGEKRAIPLVIQIIEQRQFIDRDREEKMEIFEALGRLGSEQILPMLKNILLRTSFLRRQKFEELREGAAAALAFMGTQGAMEILKEAAREGGEAIDAATAAGRREASLFSKASKPARP
jgi:HEAT repeat protein